MANLYISDLHLNHDRLLQVEWPRYESMEIFKALLYAKWVQGVSPKDDVYVLGDVCFHGTTGAPHDFMASLPGRKHLIVGNHDPKYVRDWSDVWVSVHEQLMIKDNGQLVFMCHYPMQSWPSKFYGTVHMHGHIHGNYWECGLMPNRYNAFCKELDLTPRPLSWFTEKRPIDPDYYARLDKICNPWKYDRKEETQ